jgi:hypothetical protein
LTHVYPDRRIERCKQTDTYSETQAYRWKDTLTHSQSDSQAETDRVRQTYSDIWTGRHTNSRPTDRQEDKQTD